MASSNQYKEELDFSDQIKSEVENGSLTIPGLEKEGKKEEAKEEDKKESLGQDMAVLVSNRILKCLEAKSKEFDCNIEELITIFKNATINFSCSTATKMQWGIVRVNQYLKTIKNKTTANITHLDYTLGADLVIEVGTDIDVFENVKAEELDVAFADIKKFNLAGLSFLSWDDLYIEDRDRDCSHELLRKYI